jgi:hypothetical protein
MASRRPSYKGADSKHHVPVRPAWLPCSAWRSPSEAWPQLVGQDLDHRSGAAVLGGPAPLLEPAQDHDPAALRQGLAGVLGLVAPDDHGEERRLLLPPTRHCHPEHGPSDATLGVADLGVIGEVAAKLTPAWVMVLPLPVAWPGGLPCPWNRGTVDTVACRESARGKRRSQRSRPCMTSPALGRLGCRVGWWGACGWGSGMPAPSGQIPPPWARWENEAPRRESGSRLVTGSAGCRRREAPKLRRGPRVLVRL